MRAETIKKAELAKLPDAVLAVLAHDAQKHADRLQREAASEQRVADMARKVMRARRKGAMPRVLP